MTYKKKLIEVALPLDAINKASAREKSIRHGHPSTLHLWWARRPLAAARAVIFAQMVDDPSANPDLFPTEKAQEKERNRLFKIIEELVLWENTNNEEVLQRAREEIWQSWRRACSENADHPRAEELFDRNKLPAFHDPFAGGGALPLEAQRLGLEAYASDLNPVAVLINKAMIEIPPKFANMPPVNPDAQNDDNMFPRKWKGAEGLAEDVRYYGKWMRDEAEKRIGHLYPKVEITPEMVKERPDLKPYLGKRLTVIAWIWARTVKSPNPAFAHVYVPLTSTFMLSTKKGRSAYIEPVVNNDSYSFVVKLGMPINREPFSNGTKISRGSFKCLLSGSPISLEYIKEQGVKKQIRSRLLAVILEGKHERVYISSDESMERISKEMKPDWEPNGSIPAKLSGGTCVPYGFKEWKDIFTQRQLIAITTLSDVLTELDEVINNHINTNDTYLKNMNSQRDQDGSEYAKAVIVYLSFLINQVANHSSNLCGWNSTNSQMRSVFARQALPMIWDYAESNPFCHSSGSLNNLFERMLKGFSALGLSNYGYSLQADANTQSISKNKIISTDPPYYDNIFYADLSDFFYIWQRKALKHIYPMLYATLAVPKTEELVATPHRHGGKDQAELFFLKGMTNAMKRIAEQAHPHFPITIYYAFKQAESRIDGIASTGWETFLEAVLKAGFMILGTLPIRTEREARSVSIGTNALASSIIIVCRKLNPDSPIITRREFLNYLKSELLYALRHMQRSNIAPVDLAQSAIGPGMAVYTRYSKVVDAAGQPLTVREALTLINQVLDEVLAEQEGDFDADSRWALAWFEQFGFSEGEYGIAETLSKAKNTSVNGLVEAGILVSSRGKVRLLKPAELPADWDPENDARLTNWEMVHHLIRELEANGERAAAVLVAKLGAKAETARDLAYRLYSICERKKRAAEALSYNGLVQSWLEIARLSGEEGKRLKPQTSLFEDN